MQSHLEAIFAVHKQAQTIVFKPSVHLGPQVLELAIQKYEHRKQKKVLLENLNCTKQIKVVSVFSLVLRPLHKHERSVFKKQHQ